MQCRPCAGHGRCAAHHRAARARLEQSPGEPRDAWVSPGIEAVEIAARADDAVERLPELDAHAEDHLDEIVFASAGETVRLKIVKPCARCPIPDVDPVTAVPGHAVGDVLRQYRADADR